MSSAAALLSAPDKVRCAALGHGLDALLEVGGLAEPCLLLELMLGRLANTFGEIGTQAGTGCNHPQRSILRNLGSELLRRDADFLLRNEHIGKPDAMGLFAGEAPARQEQELRLGFSDHFRQRHRQPETGVKTKPREIRAKARLRTCHAEIGDKRKAEAPSNSRPVYRCYDRFFGAE